MKKNQNTKPQTAAQDDMLPEYHFDYSKARPNRFAAQMEKNQRAVILDPDVAEFFTTSEAVNKVLRALITTMPEIAK